ncbi:hypothetical protein KCU78_g3889, partial [Aureobasidium melanogenum]
MASDNNTDWHSRLNKIVQLFRDENHAMCERELRTVLGYPTAAPLLQDQMLDHPCSHHQTCAEAIWHQWRMMCPEERTDDNDNHVMNRLRGMLDNLEEDMIADRPEDWYKLDGVVVSQGEPEEGDEMTAESEESDPVIHESIQEESDERQ